MKRIRKVIFRTRCVRRRVEAPNVGNLKLGKPVIGLCPKSVMSCERESIACVAPSKFMRVYFAEIRGVFALCVIVIFLGDSMIMRLQCDTVCVHGENIAVKVTFTDQISFHSVFRQTVRKLCGAGYSDESGDFSGI